MTAEPIDLPSTSRSAARVKAGMTQYARGFSLPGDWVDEAACAPPTPTPPDWWFQHDQMFFGPDTTTFVNIKRQRWWADAALVCEGCPVLEDCQRWAVGHSAPSHGVFGALTAQDRAAAKKTANPLADARERARANIRIAHEMARQEALGL